MITCQRIPEEAFTNSDRLSVKLTEQVQKLTKQVLEARCSTADDFVTKPLTEYDETPEKCIPMLIAQANISGTLKIIHW